ncbi:MAG: hypothetical protein A3C93_04905 [Candidatus Lloydbacteria bacterium RIFCSPHIGHO2_02_FULL_54_17]|uniref:Uncharacterized protein n=1 Tax=Candidatus Lloydbacteria bacterium RIFCSPHIGHO2_02_FULL_54_17 TaxID=1798664 RepID=A0A1G2DL95_9BACT|nr:MAG: hypothetical protein A2762_04095 [Candidatus Lloydbacteria bacterium RIFCSPHIGHO2_01_FULL_54_11]OGZ13578.1 MAG: hypothetical protein A3C93_04905 [Candidatus Lloydbacteria bacterium RIFCSPHIGHO2_02_FULL_54_17]OGZ15415.1 MAG: hypothetical protein A2948_06065 [Candidatus Lloydbacteria bacterium RIFCSPLOWO2_01_FULL_54_18]
MVCGGLILAVSIAGILGLEITHSVHMTVFTLLVFAMGMLVGWICTKTPNAEHGLPEKPQDSSGSRP